MDGGRNRLMTRKPTTICLAATWLLLVCQSARGAEPVATAYTNWDDVSLALMVVERKGNVLTIKWAVRNEGEEQQEVKFSLTRAAARTFAVDEENGTKYFVLTDEQGNCLASECVYLGQTEGIAETVDAGKTRRFWMKLPAPPPEVTSLTLFFDETEPLEDVPITDK